MILESIVSTVDVNGQVNIAPMGPIVSGDQSDPQFTLRPFISSKTYQNLLATKRAVIHVTDDVWLFAQAAVNTIDQATAESLVRVIDTGWVTLKDCHRWFAVQIESTSGNEPRIDMHCKTIDSKVMRPFFGFNRAKHAVIEAAILATRTHILDANDIAQQIASLKPLIDKTGGEDEHQAFEFLCETIKQRLSNCQVPAASTSAASNSAAKISVAKNSATDAN